MKRAWTEQETLYAVDSAYRMKRLKRQQKLLRLKIGVIMQKLKDEMYRCIVLTRRSERSVRGKLDREMKKIKGAACAIVCLLCLLASSVRADVPAAITYSVDQQSDSQWFYLVTITNNTTDQNIWDVSFATPGITPLHGHANWGIFPSDGAVEFMSFLPGSPPDGTDVPFGSSITFDFLTPTQPPAIAFALQFADVSGGNAERAGVLNADGSVVFTPEAPAICLLGLGALALLGRRRCVC